MNAPTRIPLLDADPQPDPLRLVERGRVGDSTLLYDLPRLLDQLDAADERRRLQQRLADCRAAMTGNGARDYLRFFAAVKEDERRTGKANLPGDGGIIL